MITIASIQPLKSTNVDFRKPDYPRGYKKWAGLIDSIVYDFQSGIESHDIANKYGVKYTHLKAIVHVFGYKISELKPT